MGGVGLEVLDDGITSRRSCTINPTPSMQPIALGLNSGVGFRV